MVDGVCQALDVLCFEEYAYVSYLFGVPERERFWALTAEFHGNDPSSHFPVHWFPKYVADLSYDEFWEQVNTLLASKNNLATKSQRKSENSVADATQGGSCNPKNALA